MITTRNLRKRILYRGQKRGFLESEIIFESFIKQFLPQMDDQELIIVDLLLSHDDPEIRDWISNKEVPPEEFRSILEQMRRLLS